MSTSDRTKIILALIGAAALVGGMFVGALMVHPSSNWMLDISLKFYVPPKSD